jgi:hypothetical protein
LALTPNGVDHFRVEHVTTRDARLEVGPSSPLATPNQMSSLLSGGFPTCNSEPSSPSMSVTPDMVKSVTPDNNANNAPHRFRAMRNILGVAPASWLTDRSIIENLLAAIGEQPGTMDESLKAKEWHVAMKDELTSIEENETWSQVHLPKGHRAIGLKWVFKLKRDEHGNVIRHKARLIAKGYV